MMPDTKQNNIDTHSNVAPKQHVVNAADMIAVIFNFGPCP